MIREIIPFVYLFVVIVLVWRICWHIFGACAKLLDQLCRQLPDSPVGTRANTMREGFTRRLPRTARFIGDRLDPRHVNGLPLTLMFLAAIYVLSLLGGLVEELMEADELVRFDKAVNGFLLPYRTPAAIAIFSWITDLGGSTSLTAVALVSTGFLWAYRHGYMTAPLWISFAGALATTYAGKFAIARERPEFLTDVTALTPSFPSGHATGAMAVYGFIAYAISRDLPTARQRFEIAYWALVLIGLIGFSRIFLSVHFASDVAAGFLVGGFWLLFGFAVAEQLRGRGKISRRPS